MHAASLAIKLQAGGQADSTYKPKVLEVLLFTRQRSLLELHAFGDCSVHVVPPQCDLLENVEWLLPADGTTYTLTWEGDDRPVLMLLDLPPALGHRVCIFDVQVDGVQQHAPQLPYSDIFELAALKEGLHRVELSAVCTNEGIGRVWKPPARSFAVECCGFCDEDE